MFSEVKNKNELNLSTGYMLDDRQYFDKVVHIFTATSVAKDDHLTDRELDYFYCAHKCISGGSRDLLDKNNIETHFSTFKNKNTCKIWLDRVRDKGWIEEHKGKQYLIGEFENLDKLDITRIRIDLIRKVDDQVS